MCDNCGNFPYFTRPLFCPTIVSAILFSFLAIQFSLRMFTIALTKGIVSLVCTAGLLEVSGTSRESNWNLHCWGSVCFARPNIVSFVLALSRFSSVNVPWYTFGHGASKLTIELVEPGGPGHPCLSTPILDME